MFLKDSPDPARIQKTWNNPINQLKLNVIYRTLRPTTAKCIFFLGVHEIFSRIDHRTNINTIKTIQSIFTTTVEFN